MEEGVIEGVSEDVAIMELDIVEADLDIDTVMVMVVMDTGEGGTEEES